VKFIDNPLMFAVACVFWVLCVLELTIPDLRARARRISLFFRRDTPIGRGVRRAASYRTCALLAVLTGYIVLNFDLAADVAKVVLLGLSGLAVASFALLWLVVFVNRPRFLAPTSMRGDPGAIREWLDSRAKR
jgi:hypothetical protein